MRDITVSVKLDDLVDELDPENTDPRENAIEFCNSITELLEINHRITFRDGYAYGVWHNVPDDKAIAIAVISMGVHWNIEI